MFILELMKFGISFQIMNYMNVLTVQKINSQAEDELAKNKKEQTMRQEENQKSMESPKPGVDSGQI